MSKPSFIFSLNAEYRAMTGGAKYALEIAKRFDKIGQTVLTTSGFLRKEYQKSGYNYNILSFTKDDKAPYIHQLLYFFIATFQAFFVTLKYLRQEKKTGKKTYYFSGGEYFPDIILAFLFRLLGLVDVWVVTSHLRMLYPWQHYEDAYTNKTHALSPVMTFNWFSQLLATTLFRIAPGVKHYFAVNTEIQDFLSSRGISSKLTFNAAESVETMSNIGEQTKIYDAVFLGRFHAQKGVQFLIPITEEILKYKADFKLLVIGGADYRIEEALKQEIADHNLEKNITLVGQKIGTEKLILLKQSKVFFFPSTYESFGIVILEALGLGLPVIAFELPFFAGLFGQSITCVPLEDVQEYAQAFLKIYPQAESFNKNNPAVQEVLKKYTWDNTFEVVKKNLKGLD